jgi:hypothetical protein
MNARKQKEPIDHCLRYHGTGIMQNVMQVRAIFPLPTNGATTRGPLQQNGGGVKLDRRSGNGWWKLILLLSICPTLAKLRRFGKVLNIVKNVTGRICGKASKKW